jgi:serine/threonine protein kinase
LNHSAFEEKSKICNIGEVSNEIYDRVEDEFLVLMKSKPHWANVEKSLIENELENLINLRHPCIACPIGFVFPIESDNRQEFQIVRMYFEGCSLLEVISVNPTWWTSTVKAKAVSGIVLGLRFAHSLGLLHGHLTTSNILFDSDHCIQIVDFNSNLCEVVEGESEGESENENEEGTQLGGFSDERWTPEKDIQAFARILFELVVGSPPEGDASIPTGIPDFVSMMIKLGLFHISGTSYSFNTILDVLKKNDFEIIDGVGSAEVSAFVSWIESTEQAEK